MRLDLHLHTRRYSGDSSIDEFALIPAARRAGLDGLVITEHHAQWRDEELEELKARAGDPDFVLLAGFEFSSNRGDMLIYGLSPDQVAQFVPGTDPEPALERALDLGAAVIAAHPTRAAIPFAPCIRQMAFHGVEVASCNLNAREQALGNQLARELGLPGTSSSDAHRIEDVGRFSTHFLSPVGNMADLLKCLKYGTFSYAGTVHAS